MLTLSEAIDLATQWQSPFNRPALSAAEEAEVARDIARALRAGGMTVPTWIDPSSRFNSVEPVPGTVPQHRSLAGLTRMAGALTGSDSDMDKGDRKYAVEAHSFITMGSGDDRKVIPLDADKKIIQTKPLPPEVMQKIHDGTKDPAKKAAWAGRLQGTENKSPSTEQTPVPEAKAGIAKMRESVRATPRGIPLDPEYHVPLGTVRHEEEDHGQLGMFGVKPKQGEAALAVKSRVHPDNPKIRQFGVHEETNGRWALHPGQEWEGSEDDAIESFAEAHYKNAKARGTSDDDVYDEEKGAWVTPEWVGDLKGKYTVEHEGARKALERNREDDKYEAEKLVEREEERKKWAARKEADRAWKAAHPSPAVAKVKQQQANAEPVPARESTPHTGESAAPSRHTGDAVQTTVAPDQKPIDEKAVEHLRPHQMHPRDYDPLHHGLDAAQLARVSEAKQKLETGRTQVSQALASRPDVVRKVKASGPEDALEKLYTDPYTPKGMEDALYTYRSARQLLDSGRKERAHTQYVNQAIEHGLAHEVHPAAMTPDAVHRAALVAQREAHGHTMPLEEYVRHHADILSDDARADLQKAADKPYVPGNSRASDAENSVKWSAERRLRGDDSDRAQIKASHRAAVLAALGAGKDVPTEALAAHSDLAEAFAHKNVKDRNAALAKNIAAAPKNDRQRVASEYAPFFRPQGRPHVAMRFHNEMSDAGHHEHSILPVVDSRGNVAFREHSRMASWNAQEPHDGWGERERGQSHADYDDAAAVLGRRLASYVGAEYHDPIAHKEATRVRAELAKNGSPDQSTPAHMMSAQEYMAQRLERPRALELLDSTKDEKWRDGKYGWDPVPGYGRATAKKFFDALKDRGERDYDRRVGAAAALSELDHRFATGVLNAHEAAVRKNRQEASPDAYDNPGLVDIKPAQVERKPAARSGIEKMRRVAAPPMEGQRSEAPHAEQGASLAQTQASLSDAAAKHDAAWKAVLAVPEREKYTTEAGKAARANLDAAGKALKAAYVAHGVQTLQHDLDGVAPIKSSPVAAERSEALQTELRRGKYALSVHLPAVENELHQAAATSGQKRLVEQAKRHTGLVFNPGDIAEGSRAALNAHAAKLAARVRDVHAELVRRGETHAPENPRDSDPEEYIARHQDAHAKDYVQSGREHAALHVARKQADVDRIKSADSQQGIRAAQATLKQAQDSAAEWERAGKESSNAQVASAVKAKLLREHDDATDVEDVARMSPAEARSGRITPYQQVKQIVRRHAHDPRLAPLVARANEVLQNIDANKRTVEPTPAQVPKAPSDVDRREEVERGQRMAALKARASDHARRMFGPGAIIGEPEHKHTSILQDRQVQGKDVEKAVRRVVAESVAGGHGDKMERQDHAELTAHARGEVQSALADTDKALRGLAKKPVKINVKERQAQNVKDLKPLRDFSHDKDVAFEAPYTGKGGKWWSDGKIAVRGSAPNRKAVATKVPLGDMDVERVLEPMSHNTEPLHIVGYRDREGSTPYAHLLTAGGEQVTVNAHKLKGLLDHTKADRVVRAGDGSSAVLAMRGDDVVGMLSPLSMSGMKHELVDPTLAREHSAKF